KEVPVPAQVPARGGVYSI
ncbi:hypothetical protein CPC197_0373B, partial [Chlamydia psittaci C1/97]